MPEEPYTPAELDAGCRALYRLPLLSHPGTRRSVTSIVLAAVLPDHDARVRAEERAQVAKQITDWAGYGYGPDWEQGYRAAMHAAEIARGNTTTEEDPDGV